MQQAPITFSHKLYSEWYKDRGEGACKQSRIPLRARNGQEFDDLFDDFPIYNNNVCWSKCLLKYSPDLIAL